MAVQWPLVFFSILTGISSGMMIFVGIGEIKGRFKDVRFLVAVIAFVALVAGGCASVFHLGHPERSLHILGNVASGLSKELFAVGAMAVVTFVYAVLAKKRFDGSARVFGVLAVIAGAILPLMAGASYLMPSRPAWDSLTLPLMYLGTGIGCGFAVSAAIVLMKGAKDDALCAVRLAVAGIAVMVVTMISYVVWIAMAPYQNDTRSIERLLSGDMAPVFWVGVIVLGVAAPFVLSLFAVKKREALGRSVNYLWATLFCSLVGGVSLRVILYTLGTSVQQWIY